MLKGTVHFFDSISLCTHVAFLNIFHMLLHRLHTYVVSLFSPYYHLPIFLISYHFHYTNVLPIEFFL